MAGSARLRAVATEEPHTVEFQMQFRAPAVGAPCHCALAKLDTGDGRVVDLGLICSPTVDTWPVQHMLALADHSYEDDGPYVATLTWGDLEIEAVVQTGEDGRAVLDGYPALLFARVTGVKGEPLLADVALEFADLADWHRIRVDGGGRNVRVWQPADSGEDASPVRVLWRFAYHKPGPYQLFVDLIDDGGFWIMRLGAFPFDVSAPITGPDSERRPQPPDLYTDATGMGISPETGELNEDLPPWRPFRYVWPLWSPAYTYRVPGGAATSRVLAQGTYLALAAVVQVGRDAWYQTSNNDWIPASAVSELATSALRGIALGGRRLPERADAASLPEQRSMPMRLGVVTTNSLSVRAGPGTHFPVVAQLREGSRLHVREQVVAGGAVWYCAGDQRWVHSEWVRLAEEFPAAPKPEAIREGVVTAYALNVRARPGANGDSALVGKLLRHATVTIYEELRDSGAVWYRVGDGRWVNGRWVRVLSSKQNGGEELQDSGDWELPAGWVKTAALNVRSRPDVSTDDTIVAKLAHNEPVRIRDVRFVDGVTWYRIGMNKWVYAPAVAVARERQRPLGIGEDEQWVAVNLDEQTLVAYEGDKPVFAAMVATGMARTPTVQGLFRTWWRVDWRKMSGGSAATGGSYYLEAVPWTCYFYSGYAFHGAYWHDGFGMPRSHGCVNLSLYDSWWIYQWSMRGGPYNPAVYVYRE